MFSGHLSFLCGRTLQVLCSKPVMLSYRTVIFGLWITTLVYWAVTAVRDRKYYAARSRGPSSAPFTLGFLLLTYLILQLPSVHERVERLSTVDVGPERGIASMLLVVAGTGLAIWARAHLGKNWGIPMTVKQKPELVTSGPYKTIRHPIYAGFMLALLGSTLTTGVIWIVVLLPVCGYFVFSAFREEKALASEFSAQYAEYKKRSRMLLPFIF